jgi:hypothetical protein
MFDVTVTSGEEILLTDFVTRQINHVLILSPSGNADLYLQLGSMEKILIPSGYTALALDKLTIQVSAKISLRVPSATPETPVRVVINTW